MALDTIQKLMGKFGADRYLNDLPSAESMTWIEPSPGLEEIPDLLIGSIGNRNVLTYLLPRGDAASNWDVRYCLKPIGDSRATSTLPQITCDEVMEKPLIAPFKHLADGSRAKKRMLSMLIRYYFLLQGHISKIDSWNDDFSRRFSAALRKIYEDPQTDHEGHYGSRSQQKGETAEESSEPEDARSTHGSRSNNGNHVANVRESSARKQQSSPVESPHRRRHEGKSDVHRLRAFLAEHNALQLLENIPDAEDMKFVDQTYILEAQPKKLFVGTHAKSGDDIYAYMVWLQQRGFHEIRFYVESARGPKTTISAEAAGKQRILHPFTKTYPKNTGPSEQADRARLTLMIKWYFIAAEIATDCVLRETKAYPDRLRCALEYIAEQMGSAAVHPLESGPTNDGIEDEGSESSYTPEEKDTQPVLADEPTREPTRKPPPFPPTVARKSAPSIARRTVPNGTSSQLPTSKISLPTTATPEATLMVMAPPRSAKRSAEDEEFDALTNLAMKQQALTRELNNVDHELEVMDAHLEAFKEKWRRERAELEKKRDKIHEERANVRNQFKKQRLLDAEED